MRRWRITGVTCLRADARVLSFIEIWCGCTIYSVRAAPDNQSPLGGSRGGIFEEVIQQDLVGLEVLL